MRIGGIDFNNTLIMSGNLVDQDAVFELFIKNLKKARFAIYSGLINAYW
jgi:hypothetical protein